MGINSGLKGLMKSVLYNNIHDNPEKRRGRVKAVSQKQNQEQRHKRTVK
jgi:hypothetical protein